MKNRYKVTVQNINNRNTSFATNMYHPNCSTYGKAILICIIYNDKKLIYRQNVYQFCNRGNAFTTNLMAQAIPLNWGTHLVAKK
jgi:hypothetical protein